jgi:hypothetical protein
MLDKLAHGHFVTAFHLVEPSCQDIIHIPTAMHMLVHVYIVWSNLKDGFKF